MILDQIVERRRLDVARLERERPLGHPPRRARANRFEAALREPGVGFICEIKKASPSRGPIDLAVDVRKRAREYQQAGARAISVLTEPHWFGGHLDDLEAAAEAVDIPLLRKDFIVEPYQVVETAHSSASALLLIVAALEQSRMVDLLAQATELGLDCLVEVHSESELDRALAARARLVGVNNRDLKTLAIDMSVSERLIPRIPSDCIAVAESGYSSPDQVAAAAERGARAFLVGEAFMAAGRPQDTMQRLLGRGVGRDSGPDDPPR